MNNEFTLEQMKELWQQESRRIDEIARQHPLTESQVNFPALELMSLYRRLPQFLIRIVLCLIALVWVVQLQRTRVADAWDSLPFLVAGGLLLYALASSLRTVSLVLHYRFSRASPIHLPDSTLARFRPRLAILTSAALLLLAVAVPNYDGRTMSTPDRNQRTEALLATNQALTPNLSIA